MKIVNARSFKNIALWSALLVTTIGIQQAHGADREDVAAGVIVGAVLGYALSDHHNDNQDYRHTDVHYSTYPSQNLRRIANTNVYAPAPSYYYVEQQRYHRNHHHKHSSKKHNGKWSNHVHKHHNEHIHLSTHH